MNRQSTGIFQPDMSLLKEENANMDLISATEDTFQSLMFPLNEE